MAAGADVDAWSEVRRDCRQIALSFSCRSLAAAAGQQSASVLSPTRRPLSMAPQSDGTPLMAALASEFPRPDNARSLLLDFGAKADDARRRPADRHSALQAAAHVGSLELINLLLPRIPGLELAEECQLALHGAVASGSAQCCRRLIAAGADPSTPRGVVRPNEVCECAHLVHRDVEVCSLNDPPLFLRICFLQRVRAEDSDDEHEDLVEPSPLSLALTAPPSVLRALLSAPGVEMDYVDDEYNEPLLFIAAAIDNGDATTVPSVLTLLEAGASVNATNRFGEVPLHEAGMAMQGAVVRVLLEEAGERPDAPSRTCGEAPLFMAVGEAHVGEASTEGLLRVLETLLEHGAEPDLGGEDEVRARHAGACPAGSKPPPLLSLLAGE